MHYYLALASWAVTPLLLFMFLGRDESVNLNRSSFWRANLAYFLALNLLLVTIEFYNWVMQTPASYQTYTTAVLIQYALLALIWLAAGQVSHIHNEFENTAAVGAGRKENLQEHIEATAQTLYQLTNHHPSVKKSVDQLLDELRFVPKYTSQTELSRLSQLVHGWSSDQVGLFQDFTADGDQASKQLEAFQRDTRTLSQKLGQSKSA
jgi:hypothetical protein